MICRCGRATETEHPCHGEAYTCPNLGTERMLTYPTCLAGAQFKLGGYQTWACDECWAVHLAQLRLHAMVLQIVKAEGIRDTQGECGFAFDPDLGAWILDVNGETQAVYEPADYDGLATIDPQDGQMAIQTIYAEKFGDEDPLSKEMIGEIRV